MKTLLEKLKKTTFTDASLNLLGEIIRKEFDDTKCEEKAFELLQLAYLHKTPQFDGMLNDYKLTDFEWLC